MAESRTRLYSTRFSRIGRWSCGGYCEVCAVLGSVALLIPPIRHSIPVDQAAGGFEFFDEKGIAAQHRPILPRGALWHRLFDVDAPGIQPAEVRPAVSYGATCSDDTGGAFAGMENCDALLLGGFLLDQHRQIECSVAIEVSLQEIGIDPGREGVGGDETLLLQDRARPRGKVLLLLPGRLRAPYDRGQQCRE